MSRLPHPFLLIWPVILLVPTGLFAQYAHAGAYMEALFESHPTYTQSLWNYVKASSQGKNARKIEKRREELIQTAAQIRRRTLRMRPYEGDASLRDSVATYFQLVYDILNEDYPKIVDLEAIAEQSYDLMEAYMLTKQAANDKLNAAADMLDQVQEGFAARHNIRLLEADQTRVSKKLEEASRVMKYYNQLYLAFFKCYKQEYYLMEALREDDVGSILQTQQALARYATEGRQLVDTLADYQGDASLRATANQLFAFYLSEGKEKAPAFSRFFLHKSQLENIQEVLDEKPQKDRTKEDIDAYNQAVDAYNQAATEFNQINQELDQQREALLKNWEEKVDNFFARHIPR